jgi:ABC-type Fe3+-citrate transport system substrate-binding protein
MLPFGGTTQQPNIVNISELLPDLCWIDKRRTVRYGIRALKILLPS